MISDNSKTLDNVLVELSQLYRESADLYKSEANDFWDSLSDEDKLYAFYSVVSRIYKGEIEKRGSYRYVLYDVFGFGPEAYGLGMECGFLRLHNAIIAGEGINEQSKVKPSV